MVTAIPFEILLCARESEASFIPREDILGRLTWAFPDIEMDAERGEREVLARMRQKLDMGMPEVFVRSMPKQAADTSYVAVRWPQWPHNRVWGHVNGLHPDDGCPLHFVCEPHDFALLKFAAGELATALGMDLYLETTFNHAVETESWPGSLDPLEWIRQRYAALDENHFVDDPETGECLPAPKRSPTLRELPNWPETLRRALCRYLRAYRRENAEAMTRGFATFEDYAAAYVREIAEFAPVRHCWSVELEESHHNEVLIDHGEWLTRIDLKGVPRGLFDD